MADHNDPNAVNTIFSDIDVSAADVYDMFGFPSAAADDTVVLALTFASVPEAGVLDTDMLYRLRLTAHPRIPRASRDWSLGALLKYAEGVKDKYLDHFSVAEIRVRSPEPGRAKGSTPSSRMVGDPGRPSRCASPSVSTGSSRTSRSTPTSRAAARSRSRTLCQLGHPSRYRIVTLTPTPP